ncbi:hypothetical protein AXG93_473s1060 [Marchantia polymorpha subsp. ruderalis]|uniref:RNA helicase n=1 Tax=Marchantia polymorpha subsp. ruderalis TaxID=1480154 RepID=A0A176W449_MARPO|nr:hypothetical protein AXG93_473s1060 [Marchantia polymorpha subsp. ruderalis]
MTDSKGPPFQLQTSDTGPPGQDQRKGGSLLARELPVRRQKTRIVEKIKENRVTIILADTGSGKSSQVPQMLLEEGMGPIICTQPRRLAVATVAKRVAEERGCTLGGEVGYQIGQQKVSSTRSMIVFKTSGVLLEELRTNGVAAINKYKVIILDEVHERSVESDLVLTSVKHLLQSTSVKLVLMSATADLLKYEVYFKDIDRGERVEKIAIQNLADKLQSMILNTKVSYLEQVVKLLGNVPEHVALLDRFTEREEVGAAERGIDIGDGTLMLIRDLILHLHSSEPDLKKNVLVFLPTYRSLEQQWLLLNASKAPFKIFVLHSSVDIEDSIRAMEVSPVNRRKVILATNVAESSVTIPGVSFVIDSCRSLEIFWDRDQKKHKPRLKWISESQANQRKGRTGRTCDGVVYRMVPRNMFLRFDKFETPAMQLISLKKQVLMILTSVSKALNDPSALLKKCMNPPHVDTIEDALDALKEMKAIEYDQKGKHRPTFYGRLLVCLPLSLESAIMVVRGGQLGYTREAALLAAIQDCTPNPISRPFGNPYKYQQSVANYYKPEDGEEVASLATNMLANMYAYEFWQRSFQDKQRLRNLSEQARTFVVANGNVKNRGEETELDWCSQHQLNLTALRAVAETVEAIMEALHRFRPEFLNNVSGPPTYITHAYDHVCEVSPADSGNGSVHGSWYHEVEHKSDNDREDVGHENGGSMFENGSFATQEERKCLRIPYTSNGTHHSLEVERILTALLIQAPKGEERPPSTKLEEIPADSESSNVPLCGFFLRGMCIKGDDCNYSHSRTAQPTPCRFFSSPSGCRYDAEEDTAKHQELVQKLFASLSVLMETLRLQPIPVIVTLCNDQFCRWRVERAARASFFFLTCSLPFDSKAFGGYHPIRNNLLSTFPVEKALVYMFEHYPPPMQT